MVAIAHLGEALHDLGGRVAAEVDREGTLRGDGLDEVAEVLAALKAVLLEPLFEELDDVLEKRHLHAGEILARGQAQGELWVLQGLNNKGLVDGDREHLARAVHADDAAGRFVRGGTKDGLAGNAVHVEAGARLQVV
ncbi:MAG: hypothetical protein ACK55I_25315, partial [bacterium]